MNDKTTEIIPTEQKSDNDIKLENIKAKLNKSQNEFVKLLLQCLIGKVDTKLFKRVDGKTLKAKNIQYTRRGADILLVFPHDTIIDFSYHPQE